jgi:hypothetical protein
MFIVAAGSGLVAAVAQSVGSGFPPRRLALGEGATRSRGLSPHEGCLKHTAVYCVWSTVRHDASQSCHSNLPHGIPSNAVPQGGI